MAGDRTYRSIVDGAFSDLKEEMRAAQERIAMLKARHQRLSEQADNYEWVMNPKDAELRMRNNQRYFGQTGTYFLHDPVTLILEGILREERDAAEPCSYYRNNKKANLANELLRSIDGRQMDGDEYLSIVHGMHRVFTTGDEQNANKAGD